MKSNIILAASAMLMAPLAAAQAQSGASNTVRDSATQRAEHVLTSCSKVLGLKVQNGTDKSIGEIGDLVVDPSNGDIRYAVLDVGGFLGMGEDHRVVPWALIQVSTDAKDPSELHVRTNVTETQLKSAATCKKDQVVGVDIEKRIDTAFGANDAWSNRTGVEPTLAMISRMDDVVLHDSAGREVGKVQSLILAPVEGCIAYAVVDTTREFGDKDVALPYARLSYKLDPDNKLSAQTPVEAPRFESAPEYDSKDMRRMSSDAYVNELASYYTCQPFWKSARAASTLRTGESK